MKKLIYCVIVLSLVFSLAGCSSIGSWLFPTPAQKQDRAVQKVEQTKESIEKKDELIINKGRGYVWAANLALESSPDKTNRHIEVSKGFTQRAIDTLGPPEMGEIIELRRLVNNLLSTNKEIILKAENELADKDLEVSKIQQKIKLLESTLESKELKLKEINEKNSLMADSWNKVTKIFWWVVWIIGIGFVLSVLGKVLPPPYNTISSLVSIPISFIVRLIHGLIPNIKQLSGVVSQEVHQESEKALKQLVEGIQELKTKKKTTFEEIEPFLKETTDKDVKQTITKKLQELGYI